MVGGQREPTRMTPRLIAVAVLGFLLFTPPLLSIFDRAALVFGVPIFVVYLFSAWALIIGLVAAISSGSGQEPQ